VRVRRFVWSTLLSLTALSGRSAQAGEPAPLAPLPAASAGQNQILADIVVSSLRQSGVLRRYRVDVAAQSGVVELTGTVTDAAQRDEVLRLVQGIPAVDRVVDHLRVTAPASGLVTAQGPDLLPKAADPLPPPLPDAEALPAPVAPAPAAPRANGSIPDPVPMARMAPPANAELNPPRMPPYAWPNYAAYNNFSRCATPTAYPAQAFPFIGPVYPFPKVPMGWRSVKLEWDDGYWWYGQVGNKYNWWKLRYW
jgi:BON domain